MSFDGLLDTAFEQIRHYAVADIAVSLRLMRAYNDIARTAPHADLRASPVAKNAAHAAVVLACALIAYARERQGEAFLKAMNK
jgi:uncharacterized membrane protein